MSEVSGTEKKAYVPIVLTELGIISEVTRVEAKVLLPIEVTEFPKVSEVMGESKKAEAPIDVTESGIVTDRRRPVKSEPAVKAVALMVITLGSITRMPAQYLPSEASKVEVETVYVSPVQAISTEPFAFALGADKKLVNKVRSNDATMEVRKPEINLIKLSPEISLNS